MILNRSKNSTKKNIKQPQSSKIYNDFLFIPLKYLDHLMKYNKYVKPYYYKLMLKLVKKEMIWESSDKGIQRCILFFQIFPRIILITFLSFDIFYFSHMKIFYKIIVIELLPLVYRYYKYCLNDILEQWIQDLEERYSGVLVHEEGFKYKESRIGNTEAIFHYEKKTIREYIEIKFENYSEYYFLNTVDYKYTPTPYNKNDLVFLFKIEKYNTVDMEDRRALDYGLCQRRYSFLLELEESKILNALFEELMPSVHILKIYNYHIYVINETTKIKWSKIIIFLTYFICWCYILCYSYYKNPINSLMLFEFLNNLNEYLYKEFDVVSRSGKFDINNLQKYSGKTK